MRTMIELFSLAEAGAPISNGWIQIMKTGKFKYEGKDIEITRQDLQEFKENFDKRVRGIQLFVDINHDENHESYGEFKALKVDGDKLFAQIDWTEEGAQLLKSKKYRYFSPEFAFKWTDSETQKTYSNVLFGGGLTNRPFLKDMEPIQFAETDGADDLGYLWFAEKAKSTYDPDGDGDDDSTTDPTKNPDWKTDVTSGITPWPSHDPEQQKELMKDGATKEACDAAFSARQKQMGDKGYGAKMAESLVSIMMAEDVTNAHKSPPKGKPTDKGEYADPEHYKYPIDAKHIHAAVSYFNHPGMQGKGGYSADEWSSIGRKIASAANRLIGPGHKFSDGKIDTAEVGKKTMEEPIPPGYAPDTPKPKDDTSAGQFKEGGGSMETVSMAEFTAAQERIKLLEGEQRKAKMSETVRGFIQAGKVTPANNDKMVEFMTGLSDEQVAKFSEIVNAQPQFVGFQEVGMGGNVSAHGGGKQEKDGKVLLTERTQKLMKEDKSLSFAEAGRQAYDELIAEGVEIDIHGKPLA